MVGEKNTAAHAGIIELEIDVVQHVLQQETVKNIGMEILQAFSEKQSWQAQANCLGVDPNLFFPERGASTKEAKEVCRGCVVKDDCLEFAIKNSEKFGIWGGMSERERRRIRRARVEVTEQTALASKDSEKPSA